MGRVYPLGEKVINLPAIRTGELVYRHIFLRSTKCKREERTSRGLKWSLTATAANGLLCEEHWIPMFWQRKEKKGLYYMLPGMNRGNRRKHQLFLRWSIAVG